MGSCHLDGRWFRILIQLKEPRRADTGSGRDARDLGPQKVYFHARKRGIAWNKGVQVSGEVSLNLDRERAVKEGIAINLHV